MPIDKNTFDSTIEIFERLIKILHPYMPFITEEIFHIIKERKEDESLMIKLMPSVKEIDREILDNFDLACEKISSIRQLRNEKNISLKQELELYIKETESDYKEMDGIIAKLCNLSKIEYIKDKFEGGISLMVRTIEMFIPIGDSINKEEELKKLNEDLKYYQGFKVSVEKKLSNDKFVNSAPANIVENERKKLLDANQKIETITAQIETLN